jgi:hypothetical protein
VETDWVQIKLSGHDLTKCFSFTDLHLQSCEERGAKHRYGNHDAAQSRKIIVEGYLGERAVGLYFDYSTVYKPYNSQIPDVLGYEVRTVDADHKRLLTHKQDLDAMYISVAVSYQTMIATIRGWTNLDRTLIGSNWQEGPQWHTPCYAMPTNQLWPINTLPATPELNRFIAQQKEIA